MNTKLDVEKLFKDFNENVTYLETQATRYEKLRKLNVSQFQQLYLESLKGTASFDSLVDGLK